MTGIGGAREAWAAVRALAEGDFVGDVEGARLLLRRALERLS